MLFGLPDNVLCKLQSVLNAAARLVSGTRKFDHISPILKELHWLPIKQRIKYKIILLVFKSLNKLAPPYLSDKLVTKPENGLRSSNQNLLIVPRKNLKSYGDRSFCTAGPKLWNSLPRNMRQMTALELEPFKAQLKTYLFNEAFGTH